MNNLTKVIGPAPSELPFEAFLERLTKERDRVKQDIFAFNERKSFKRAQPKKKATPRKGKKTNKVLSLSKELNLSPDQMLKILEEIENEQTSK